MSRFEHLGTIIIVGGDIDFMPVAQKIKAAGRTLIVVGTRRNTNRHWAKSVSGQPPHLDESTTANAVVELSRSAASDAAAVLRCGCSCVSAAESAHP